MQSTMTHNTPRNDGRARPVLRVVRSSAEPVDFIGAVERAIAVQDAKSKHLDIATRNAVAELHDIITEAELGAPTRALRAATADQSVPRLVVALKVARDLIPRPGNEDQIREIDAAIAASTIPAA